MIAIAAVDQAWGIGRDGKLPWRLPGDLAYFKEKTLGQIVVMGRRTFESLPGGALSGRTNIVLTRNPVRPVFATTGEDADTRGALKIVRSVDELMEAVAEIRAGGFEACAERGKRGREADFNPKRVCADDNGAFTQSSKEPAVFVAGGAEVYRLLLPFTDRCFITKVDTIVGADAFFPNLDSDVDFNIVWESEAITESGLRYRFTEYART